MPLEHDSPSAPDMTLAAERTLAAVNIFMHWFANNRSDGKQLTGIEISVNNQMHVGHASASVSVGSPSVQWSPSDRARECGASTSASCFPTHAKTSGINRA
jgi:hypothetical protein